MNFGDALDAIMHGHTARLSYWRPNVHLRLQTPEVQGLITVAYIAIESPFVHTPWGPTQTEIMSEKWEHSGPKPVPLVAP